MKSYSSLILITALAVAGCAAPAIDPNYTSYLEFQKQLMMKAETPIMRMEALPGQTISLTGVKEFSVFAPNSNSKSNGVSAYQAPRNEWVEVLKATIGVVGQVGSVVAIGKSVENLSDSVGKAANHGYQYVQTPQPNMTIGGDGVIGSGSFSSLAGQGVVGSGALTLSTTLSGTGAMGAGSFTDSRSTPTTTTTDSHPVTTTTTDNSVVGP
jgi:hypothetical protein